MIALIAALVAASPFPVTQRGPWVEMQAGPQLLLRDRRTTVGPEVRLDVGVGLNERVAAEAWLSGAFEPAPLPSPDDRSRIAAGVAARARLLQFDSEAKLMLWGHAGVGYSLATPGGSGPVGFGGAQLLFQPFVKRFAFGLEIDGVALRSGFGFALLPSLRCAL
jgi:hypothetical protein